MIETEVGVDQRRLEIEVRIAIQISPPHAQQGRRVVRWQQRKHLGPYVVQYLVEFGAQIRHFDTEAPGTLHREGVDSLDQLGDRAGGIGSQQSAPHPFLLVQREPGHERIHAEFARPQRVRRGEQELRNRHR